ncbi:hypothetical protein Q4506_15175 [Colwellia sp. 4_MG-2023]|uniref:hypothetical protein n=1 Tax=unclassified Colwellia TaxID=196834 RepID=UPI00209059D8|nr:MULTISPECIES: hypothetical protein [unclassified Colwellia]MDO6489194.1 hypothetical protein [Colwellia sp. 6_MG-2023]MDO6508409.1 hypothetical protein [Colwellia sp. 5_MG-2023]MDO6557025.1 hypothetical protein [Colwellia sp. 4_MG-2023]MDO6651472.1 hypothetical protein [Colwellia sp. 3_MG-2023]MDO6666827.1 hypothetical protein [Colwellia sp. 2_MG-2023]
MKPVRNNIVIVMLMLVAFIGQAMASTAMSYSGASCVDGDMANTMPMMSHDHMLLDDSDKKTAMMASMDCCQDDCKCPSNGCLSLSFLLNTSLNSQVFSDKKITQFPSLNKSQASSSLYRPPIS